MLVAFQNTRKSARDGKRKAELEQIRSSLEIYRSDCGQYPASLDFGGSLVGSGSGACLVSNTYMAQVPQDALYNTYEYKYNRDASNPSLYTLCAYLEGDSGSVTGCGGDGNCGTVACNFSTTNP